MNIYEERVMFLGYVSYLVMKIYEERVMFLFSYKYSRGKSYVTWVLFLFSYQYWWENIHCIFCNWKKNYVYDAFNIIY